MNLVYLKSEELHVATVLANKVKKNLYHLMIGRIG